MGWDASGPADPTTPGPERSPGLSGHVCGLHVGRQHPSKVVFPPALACRRGWFPSSYTKLLEENEEEATSELAPR